MRKQKIWIELVPERRRDQCLKISQQGKSWAWQHRSWIYQTLEELTPVLLQSSQKTGGYLPACSRRPASPWHQNQTKAPRKLLPNIPYEHWHQNPEANANEPNSAACWKDHTQGPSGICPGKRKARMAQQTSCLWTWHAHSQDKETTRCFQLRRQGLTKLKMLSS